MNQMRIPVILRASTWISIPVFVLTLTGGMFLLNTDPAQLPDWSATTYSLLMSVLAILGGISFVLMVAAYSFSLLFDWILNGLLRRFGKPATATIIARHDTGISAGKWSHMWRVTLRVHPFDGAAFDAITEDMGSGGSMGERVPVKYDPLTRSVAIERPWANQQSRSYP